MKQVVTQESNKGTEFIEVDPNQRLILNEKTSREWGMKTNGRNKIKVDTKSHLVSWRLL